MFALVIREMTTRYGNKFGGYMWAVLDPVLTIAVLTSIFSAVARVPALGRSFPLFFATGYVVFYMYRSTSEQVSSAIEANRALLNYPIVTPFDAIFARILLQAATLFVVTVLLFGGLALVTPLERLNFEPIFTASFFAILLGAGVGSCNIVFFHMNSTYQQIWGIVNRPAFIISGVFFLPEALPPPFRDYLMWVPFVHLVGLFRTGFYPTYRASYVDMTYVIGFSVSTLVIGLLLVWYFDSRLREQK